MGLEQEKWLISPLWTFAAVRYNSITMKKTSLTVLLIVCILAPLVLITGPQRVQAQAGTAYDMIAAVNALRASQGLTQLEIDPVLMSVAQSHSEYQASLGYWTHEGPGGSRPRDRAMAAGFGGDATVFVSENVAVLNPTASYDTLLYSFWSDALHWNTMTNPSYTHAGAGIAVSGDKVYYTLDVGYISGSPGGYVPGNTLTPGGQALAPTAPTLDAIYPMITATPHEDGSVYHTVEQGHALWSIANAYETTIQNLIDLNGLDPESPSIWPGNELLIQPSLQPSPTVRLSSTAVPATRTPQPSSTPRPPTPTRTPTKVITPTQEPVIDFSAVQAIDRKTLAYGIIALCALGLLAVIFTGFRPSK